MSIRNIKTWLIKYYVEIMILLVFLCVVVNQVWFKGIASNGLYSVAFAAISLLLISVRTRVLLEEYKEKVRGRTFNEYHKLIRVMNGVEDYFEDEERSPAREVQCAAIFELRNYPEYKDFTYRTLTKWKQKTDEEWDEKVDRQVNNILEKYKKDGKVIPDDIKNSLRPLLQEIKNKKRVRYYEEIDDTLKGLGFDV